MRRILIVLLVVGLLMGVCCSAVADPGKAENPSPCGGHGGGSGGHPGSITFGGGGGGDGGHPGSIPSGGGGDGGSGGVPN